MKRRDLLKGLTVLPLAGGILSGESAAATNLSSLANTAAAAAKRDLFKELGVRTFINARATLTFMTGSLMQDEVLDAIKNSSRRYCMLDELQDKVGAKIAELCHAEAATVTSGAFSAIMLGTAGVLSGLDAKKAAMIPHLEGSGMKTEVILQKGHNIGYYQAMKNCGVTMVWVETREELERAINDKTAMMAFMNCNTNSGQIKHKEWLEVAKRRNIPTLIDIAADVPPIENFWKFNDMGFDLVCLSGGKAIRGPQSSGVLMGRKDLIAAARLSASPRGSTIGRGHKVNKEEILGLYVAIEKFIRTGEDEWNFWMKQIAHIENAVKNIKSVKTRVFVPELANATPNLEISWDPAVIPVTGQQIQERLSKGEPGIELNAGKNNISLVTFIMVPGEEKIVATRIKEELSKA
ncbi:aminotransferase class V-fold PLP-dependent enzyme [Daejeonella sp.]|uniref:aminotransferase class V-fold PLP-dependent enzyme n=1 Tax=Daejeonella sp. TaxID=2805397 RepID=UPI0027312046|nr:aminotransferase class V-fold PLP-dependent enzyme [Daejeonella sp.]MDP2413537.1 aminotransferase class V-fold PLP-dependent enzyme [Daejeonella sp.]